MKNPNLSEEQKHQKVEDLVNDLENNIDSIDERIEKEIIPLLDILRPEKEDQEEYREYQVSKLFDEAKKVFLAKGQLIESEEESFEKAKEILISRIKSMVLDANDYEKIQKMDGELLRHAQIASLYLGDFTDVEKKYGHKAFEKANFTLGEVAAYLGVSYRNGETKLTERELDALVKAGLGEQLVVSTSLYEYEERIKNFPESFLEIMVKKESVRHDYSHIIKFALTKSSSSQKYSESFARLLVEKEYARVVIQNLDKFESLDFEELCIAANIDDSGDTKEQICALYALYGNSSKFDKYVSILLKHSSFTELGDTEAEKIVSEKYEGTLHNKVYYQYDLDESFQLPENIVKNIEDGYIGQYLHSDSLRLWLYKYKYEWMIECVKKHNQEHLLLVGFTGGYRMMKSEDQIDYAKKLLEEDKRHLLLYFVNSRNEFFEKRVLDQDIFDKLINESDDIDFRRFRNLNETSFEQMKRKYPKAFQGRNLLESSIKSFEFDDKNSRFVSYKKYQEVISKVNAEFTPLDASDLSFELDLYFEDVSKNDHDLFMVEITKKAELFKKIKQLGVESDHVSNHINHVKSYAFLLKESVADLELMIDQIPNVPKNLISMPVAYVEALKTFTQIDDKEKLKEEFSNLYTFFNGFKDKNFTQSDIYIRYFQMKRDIDTNVSLIESAGCIIEFVDVYKEQDEKTKDVIKSAFPWAGMIERLEGLQKKSARKEYDPWTNELLPLVLENKKGGALSLVNPEDAESIYDYVKTFGMKNIPHVFPVFQEVRRCMTVEEMSDDTRDFLKNSFGIDVEKLLKKDKTNMKLVIAEMAKIFPKTVKGIREESSEFLEYVSSSKKVLDIFKKIIGTSGHGHGAEFDEVIKKFKEISSIMPQKFILPKGYEEKDLAVPEIVLSDKDKEEQIGIEKQKLLSNPELQGSLSLYQSVLDSYTKIGPKLIEENGRKITDFLFTEINEIENRIAEEKNKETVNEKAIVGLEKRLADYKKRNEDLIDFLSTLTPGDMVRKMELLNDIVPENWQGKRNFLMELSLSDMGKKIPEGLANLLDLTKENALPKFHEFIFYHVKEHYLDKKHGLESSIDTDDKNLLKALRKYWGTQDYEKSILFVSHAKLKMLEKGEVSDKAKTVTLVPSKGLQRIFSGDIGKACTSRQNKRLAEGDFENIVSYSLVVDKDTNNEKFVGSFLVIETRTDRGEPVLVLRANNPQQNIFSVVDGDSLIAGILEEVKELAKRRNIKSVVVPLSGGATSNRSEVSQYYSKHFAKNEKIQLVNNEETNFNGYEIWNKEGGNAVVLVD